MPKGEILRVLSRHRGNQFSTLVAQSRPAQIRRERKRQWSLQPWPANDGLRPNQDERPPPVAVDAPSQ